MTISVICEECGRRYDVSEQSLDRIEGDTAHTRCRYCGHPITITRPAGATGPQGEDDAAAAVAEPDLRAVSPAVPAEADPAPAAPSAKASRPPQALGLRSKMIILFCVVPLALMSTAGVLSQNRIQTLAVEISGASTAALRALAEDHLEGATRSIAHQVAALLHENPTPGVDRLRRIAVQRIGGERFTALYRRPGNGQDWRMVFHPDPRLVGQDLQRRVEALGSGGTPFLEILTNVSDGLPSRGYVTVQDAGGETREWFVFCVPVAGTPYALAGTAAVAAIDRSAAGVRARAVELAAGARNINLGVLIVTLLVTFATVSIYAHSLTSRIRQLTGVAERISIGELDAVIDVRVRDEIGRLASSVARMQESLRLSIDRLRRRRSASDDG